MSTSTILKDIASLSEKDLAVRIQEEKMRYSKMKHMHAVTPLESPVILKKLRRDIARMTQALAAKKNAQ